MKNNAELQRDVQNALKWEPLLHAAEIGVTCSDGVVSLTGVVDSYLKKMEAEDAAKKVIGVKALLEYIEVKFPSSWSKTDAEVAKEILQAFKMNFSIPHDRIGVKVEKGWVTLDGDLTWNFQRKAAKKAVDILSGVKGVTNNIKIIVETHGIIEQKDVEEAIARSYAIDDSDITVSVAGTTVTLSGRVDSWYDKEEASRIAWNTPGIWNLNNNLVIGFAYAYT